MRKTWMKWGEFWKKKNNNTKYYEFSMKQPRKALKSQNVRWRIYLAYALFSAPITLPFDESIIAISTNFL